MFMVVCIHTAAGQTIKALYTAAVFSAKIAIYTAAWPTFKWLYTWQPFSMQKLLYTPLPGLHINAVYIAIFICRPGSLV